MTDSTIPAAGGDSAAVERSSGMLRRFCAVLRRPSTRFSLLTLLVAGFLLGVIAWSGFGAGMEHTNTLEFCISCHEMRDTVYQEYTKTAHFSNRSGVRATCPDCHVPKGLTHKMAAKIRAVGDVYGSIVGTIDTPEKFEAKRQEFAERVWERMKANDSRECRNCHSLEGMSKAAQTSTAWRRHKEAKTSGETCISCHKGIAHREPKSVQKEAAQG